MTLLNRSGTVPACFVHEAFTSRKKGMNTSAETVFVHCNSGDVAPVKKGEFALFRSPSMAVFHEPTRYLHHLSKLTSSARTWRNVAYALAYWHSYCEAAGIPWATATADDLLDYKDALSKTVSRQTGVILAPGTVTARLMCVISYYEYGKEKGWYQPTLTSDIRGSAETARLHRADMSASIGRGATRFLPKRREAGFDIAPFSIRELRAFLEVLGPSRSEESEDSGRRYRDRLIVDWGWAVGLRMSEITKLNIHQFLAFVIVPDSPWAHAPISILGKGGKKRNVSVPNWLIADTVSYIEKERKLAVEAGRLRNGAPTALFVCSDHSTRAGRPLGIRRIEAIVSQACVSAGLVKLVEVQGADGSRKVAQMPLHCVHDLRHTYAVLTYWSEVRSGNPEPWKKIQAQLGHSHMKTTVDTYLRFVDAHGEFHAGSIRQLIGLPIATK
jgi:integrase